jgi:O-antigen/teichoic acid export membrane protein
MIRKTTNVRNSGWNLVNILLYPALFLAATPYFIDKLSASVFGEWMLINSYIYISVHLMGFGLPDSITAHVARAIGLQDRKKLYAYINASGSLLGKMASISLLVALLLLVLYLTGFTFFRDEVWLSLIVASLIIHLRFPEILFQSIFKGFERYDLAAIYNMTNKILALAIQLYLVTAGYSLVGIFSGSLAVMVLIIGWQGSYLRGLMPDFKIKLFTRNKERKELYQFGFWSWLQTAISIASFQMDRFIVAGFLGTATVAYYVLASTIANHLNMAFDAIVAWMLPKVSRLRESLVNTKGYFHTIRAFSVGTSLLVIAALYYISGPLFTLWLGPDKYMKMIGFFRLFMIFEAFLILAIVPKFYLNAIRELAFNTILEFVTKSAVIIGMISSFLFFRSAESLIWGQVLALALSMPVIYYLINKRLLHEKPFRESILTQLPSLMVMGVLLTNLNYLSAILMTLAALFFWAVYIKDKHFDIKLLTE